MQRESGGGLTDLGTIWRESGGGLTEIGKMWRESGGSLTQIWPLGPAFSGTIRPNADVSQGGWTDENLGDNDGALWDELDEATPDGDTTAIGVLIGAGTSETFEVHLSNPSEDPNGQETQAVSMTYFGSDLDVDWTVRLLEGSTEIFSWDPGSNINDYGTKTYFLSDAEKDSISNYDDLRVEVTVSSPDLGSAQVTQIEMEFS